MPQDYVRLSAEEVAQTLYFILQQHRFSDEDALLSARLFTETSLDGVYSHGLNRFPRYVSYIRKGIIHPQAKPGLVHASEIIENWDGNLGPGNLNAFRSMERAIQLSHRHGFGMVSLRNTNHWMRGGTYGLQAADANCTGICFTNTKPNMPPWGGVKPTIGNNPFIIAVPHRNGHFLLDMAMSQFAYGKLEALKLDNTRLPFPGGYDKEGRITDDPSLILESERILPAGYWKGSGLSIMLDLLVAVLSDGKSTSEIGKQEDEYGISQVFMAFDMKKVSNSRAINRVMEGIKQSLTDSVAGNLDGKAFYPGERTAIIRNENQLQGIPVKKEVWKEITNL